MGGLKSGDWMVGWRLGMGIGKWQSKWSAISWYAPASSKHCLHFWNSPSTFTNLAMTVRVRSRASLRKPSNVFISLA